MTGTLYICATPIGNLEDITLRALRVLKEVDLIAAEDTRHTRKLLHHYDIHTPLTSYYEHNAREKGPFLLEQLRQGKSIALVSDAGTPGISDPGTLLIQAAVAAGIPVVPVPGVTAFVTALCVSGLPTDKFVFEGFLPRKDRERKKRLEDLRGEERTIIFYEAPHRLPATLKAIAEVMPRRRLVVARELTKQYEEIVRGTPAELRAHFEAHPPRGEFTLLLEGRPPEEAGDEPAVEEIPDPAALMAALEEQGFDWQDAIKEAARRLGVPKREVYRAVKIDKKNQGTS
ncbi:MAG TPA: 16S rRNA (cytidine(1402)-2'-O)-methyltransferase [Clostridia bacterium]|nr:16S rRNA (cytidine(1402)-2'-O)-methyltransferase [Clostridia bacterium]